MTVNQKNSGNSGIQITIDEKVLDALDQLHNRVTNAGLLLFCNDYMRREGHDEGYVCYKPAKDYLDKSCEDFSVIFDAIGWTYEDRRKTGNN